jgi:predicted kinase
MPTLTITRGLPGCGKTTWARAWVAEDPTARARVNRDDLRAQLHDGEWRGEPTERQIIAARDATITALLRRGVDVVCDETALPSRTARDLRRLAVLVGAGFAVVDMTDVDLDECLRRNATRSGKARLPDDRIADLHARFITGKPHPLPLADEPDDVAVVVPYEPVPGTPAAVIVDIDGTVALMSARDPYDESRVGEDRPNVPVIAVVRAMVAAGHRVVFCSGRTAGCRAATEKWLAEHVAVPYDALLMRAVGDTRKDVVVKAELFDAGIRHAYTVVGVFDDRRQVVDMWRSLGLTVLQVAPGEF